MTTPRDSLRHSGSVTVAASPETVYDMVSDVTRTGEWSPICKECWWEEGTGPRVGAVFVGRNEIPERTWETRSTVVAATRPAEFAWEVAGGWVRWGYTLEPAEGGTLLTEHWEFTPMGLAGFGERYGDDARRQIEIRTEQAHDGIPRTLAAIKNAAETG